MIIDLFAGLPVLARLEHISRSSRNYLDLQHYVLIIGFIAVVAIATGVIYVVGQLKKAKPQRSRPQEPSLITQIANELNMSVKEASLLMRLASQNQITPPEVLLVDADLWESCLQECPHDRDDAIVLMEKLFGVERCQQVLGGMQAV